MRRRLQDYGLGLFFGLLFLLALVGQAVAGVAEFNQQQQAHGGASLSLLQYVASADFAVDVAENWQSEYPQFLLYIVATVWLVHRGSPESKELDKAGRGSDEDQLLGAHRRPDSPSWARAGGWRTKVFSHSLPLVMGLIFLLSWLAQSVAGWSTYNEQQLSQYQPTVSWLGYLATPDFWSRTLQNWQSEFLAVGSMVVLSVYLRERGSPESKPVGAAHDDTGATG
ncbi:MAG: hypothetical protein M3P93_07595 [Actinomycetota bacterium]|nr:hypothetical protein [Actinomycetota bacterium]